MPALKSVSNRLRFVVGVILCLSVIAFGEALASTAATPGYPGTFATAKRPIEPLTAHVSMVLNRQFKYQFPEGFPDKASRHIAEQILKFSAVEVVTEQRVYVLYLPVVDLFTVVEFGSSGKVERVGFASGKFIADTFNIQANEYFPLGDSIKQRLLLHKVFAEGGRRNAKYLWLARKFEVPSGEGERQKIAESLLEIATAQKRVLDHPECVVKAAEQLEKERRAGKRDGMADAVVSQAQLLGLFSPQFGQNTYIFSEPVTGRFLFYGVLDSSPRECKILPFLIVFFG